ncbi:MAG: 4Fe-4S binding protein [Methanomicrobiales archaeon]
MGFFQMLSAVVRTLVRGPVTRRYPAVPAKVTALSRGHVTIDPSMCISCGLCMKRCPADAICVSKEEKTWQIDRFRCVVCGACVEACPANCLSMETAYIPPTPARLQPELVTITYVKPEKKESAPSGSD